jgi:ketosteroid isomerase-like protein
MSRPTLPTGLAAILALGCARTATVNVDAERDALRQLDAQFGALAAKKDSAGEVAMYAADAVIMPPNAPAVKGAAAIRAMWNAFLQTPGLVLRLDPEKIDIAPSGDFATDMGTVTMELDGPQGHVKDVEKYLEVWQKRDGAWRVIYDTWNANAAPAESKPAS